MFTNFEWDPEKNKANIKKHGVSFNEASSVFFDESAIVISDDEHSYDEERFVIIGLSKKTRIVVVCHCLRKAESVIRIISARKANTHEALVYAER